MSGPGWLGRDVSGQTLGVGAAWVLAFRGLGGGGGPGGRSWGSGGQRTATPLPCADADAGPGVTGLRASRASLLGGRVHAGLPLGPRSVRA